MKSHKLIYITIVALVFALGGPSVAQATSVESLKNQEAQAKQEGETLNREIEGVIDTINKKYAEVAALDQKISQSEDEIKETEDAIAATQVTIGKRTESMTRRLQEMQVREASRSNLDMLLSAESFSDFVNRAFAFTVLQSNDRTKMADLYSEQEKLATLEAKLVQTQQDLQTQQKAVEQEQQTLDKQVAGLRTKLTANTETLSALTSARIEKENSLRAAALAAQEKAREAAAKQNDNSSETPTGSTNNGETGNKPATPTPVPTPTPAPSQPSQPSGNSFPGQATAYTATGNNTATGTVPRERWTIAVDPNVIRLGSKVQITVPSMPQYSGIYTAEDTGGAIKGSIVDIFVGSDSEARQFGRRAIIITVL